MKGVLGVSRGAELPSVRPPRLLLGLEPVLSFSVSQSRGGLTNPVIRAHFSLYGSLAFCESSWAERETSTGFLFFASRRAARVALRPEGRHLVGGRPLRLDCSPCAKKENQRRGRISRGASALMGLRREEGERQASAGCVGSMPAGGALKGGGPAPDVCAATAPPSVRLAGSETLGIERLANLPESG